MSKKSYYFITYLRIIYIYKYFINIHISFTINGLKYIKKLKTVKILILILFISLKIKLIEVELYFKLHILIQNVLKIYLKICFLILKVIKLLINEKNE